jgi:hypothetical protein
VNQSKLVKHPTSRGDRNKNVQRVPERRFSQRKTNRRFEQTYAMGLVASSHKTARVRFVKPILPDSLIVPPMKGFDLKKLDALRAKRLEDKRIRTAACEAAVLPEVERRIQSLTGTGTGTGNGNGKGACFEQLRQTFIRTGSFGYASACHDTVAAPLMKKSDLDLARQRHPKVKITQVNDLYWLSSLSADEQKRLLSAQCQTILLQSLKIDVTEHATSLFDISEIGELKRLHQEHQESDLKQQQEYHERVRLEKEQKAATVDELIATVSPKCYEALEQGYIDTGEFDKWLSTPSCKGSTRYDGVTKEVLKALRLKHKHISFYKTHECYKDDSECFEDSRSNTIVIKIAPEYFGTAKD